MDELSKSRSHYYQSHLGRLSIVHQSGEKILFQGLDLVENLRESGHWQGFSSA